MKIDANNATRQWLFVNGAEASQPQTGRQVNVGLMLVRNRRLRPILNYINFNLLHVKLSNFLNTLYNFAKFSGLLEVY